MTATPTRTSANTTSYRQLLHCNNSAYANSLVAKPAAETAKNRPADRHNGACCERNVSSQWPAKETVKATSQPITFATNGSWPSRLTSSTTTPRWVTAAAQPTAMKQARRIAVFLMEQP